jgi:hypothetical protein
MSDLKCVVCNISLCSITSYRNHCSSNAHLKKLDIFHKQQQNNTQLHQNPKNVSENVELNCSYCSKSYCSKGNLTRHKKTCVELKLLKEKYIKNIDKVIDADLETKLRNAVANNDAQAGNVGNITINIQQNITNNIEISGEDFFYDFWKKAGIRPMGFEDLSCLDSQEIADKIHGFGLNCFVEFINQVYNNEVNHNIAVFNKRDKLVKYIHKSGEIKIDSLSSVMSSVLMNLVDYLDSYLEREDIVIKPEFLSIIKKLKEIHILEANPNLERYNTHLYNRLLNITTSSLKKMKNYDSKIAAELSDSLRKLAGTKARTDSRTEPDILAIV